MTSLSCSKANSVWNVSFLVDNQFQASLATAVSAFPSYGCTDDLVRPMVPWIAERALEVEHLFPNDIALLKSGDEREVALTQRQCLCLLALAFFGLHDCVFEGSDILNLCKWDNEREKMTCLMFYFHELRKRITADSSWQGSKVSFLRRHIASDFSVAERFSSCRKDLCKVDVSDTGRIEDVPNALHADFANKYIGGGVLSGGCVQEEIRFTISPECLVSMLLCERMEAREAICLRGTERFSDYSGYGRSSLIRACANTTAST
jgi:poly(ADP-ribose) glycohydrolase